MSKYINTEDLHKVVLKRKAEYGSLADLIDNIVEEMVKETPYADVVERSKVDDAIAEIKDGYYGNEEKSETDSERADAFNNGLSYALEILKRNIGE